MPLLIIILCGMLVYQETGGKGLLQVLLLWVMLEALGWLLLSWLGGDRDE